MSFHRFTRCFTSTSIPSFRIWASGQSSQATVLAAIGVPTVAGLRFCHRPFVCVNETRNIKAAKSPQAITGQTRSTCVLLLLSWQYRCSDASRALRRKEPVTTAPALPRGCRRLNERENPQRWDWKTRRCEDNCLCRYCCL